MKLDERKIKSEAELKEEYDDLMEHYRASLKMKDYEGAEYFFNEAQKVVEENNKKE